jgi:hypothetical protein
MKVLMAQLRLLRHGVTEIDQVFLESKINGLSGDALAQYLDVLLVELMIAQTLGVIQLHPSKL